VSDKTGIEWTDATWNPVTGCTKVSQGCKHCYAERDWARLQHLPAYQGRAFTDVAIHPDRLEQPLRWKRPRRIFVNSMSDLFHPDVPDVFIDQVFAVMHLSPRHIFQILTKRPERMRDYMLDPATNNRVGMARARIFDAHCIYDSGFWMSGQSFRPLPNVWLGVSVEDQSTADERIPVLMQTPAAVRWISAEPMLGPISLEWLGHDGDGVIDALTGEVWIDDAGPAARVRVHGSIETSVMGRRVISARTALDWVVVGGESGPKARPMHPRLVRSLRDQCAKVGVPFLFKQWGEWIPYEHGAQPPFLLSQHGREIDGHFLPDFESEDGQLQREWICDYADQILARRVGKKAAGRLLDGVLHDGYPGDSK
jgi:protein gp37